MVTFTLLQSVWDFAKLRAIRTMCARLVHVPSCQLLILTCQRATGVPVIQLGVTTCQRRTNFSTSPAKRCTNFSTILQNIFQFLNFSIILKRLQNFKNILAILENLSREIKNLNFDICKISLRKNLVKLKSLGLTEQLFG